MKTSRSGELPLPNPAPPTLSSARHRGRIVILLLLIWLMRVTSEVQVLFDAYPRVYATFFIVIGDLLTCFVVAYCLYLCASMLQIRNFLYLLIAGCGLVAARSVLRVFPEVSTFLGLRHDQLNALADGVLAFGGALLLTGAFCFVLISLRDAFAQLKYEEEMLRKAAEDQRVIQVALEKREHELRALTETTAAAIFIIQDGRFVYANKRAHEILGLGDAEISSASFRDIVEDSLSDDSITAANGILDGSLPKGIYQFAINSMTGQRRFLEAAIAPYAVDGQHALFVTAYDVTERKLAEDRLAQQEEWYRSIIQHSSDIVAVVGESWKIRYLSPSAYSFLGYSHDENFIGRQIQDFVHLDDLVLEANPALVAADNPHAFETGLFRVRHADGSWRTMDAMISSQLDNPSVNGLVVNARDVTDREQLEHQLRQAQKMESVGRLAGGVAHDFNNMLSVILGYTEMALESVDKDSPNRQNLMEVMDAARRSAELTRQLLAFARKQVVAPKLLRMNDTLASMLKILQRLIGEDIRLVWKPAPALWDVRMDPAQVDQIMVNLLVNARDAIGGEGVVTIETENKVVDLAYTPSTLDEGPGEYVLITVSDTGSGMDKATAEQIFEPFFTTKEQGHGTGLGLSTVYGIVKQNKGSINVYSEPGNGTTFRIYLPRHKDVEVEAPKEKDPKMAIHGTETVLLVEDETTILKMSKAILDELGYTVYAAASPAEALAIANERVHEIDLLITDVIMPGINGRALATQLSAMKPDLKCLYISGYTADVIAQRGMLEPGVNLLQKPFSIRDFAERVRKTIDM